MCDRFRADRRKERRRPGRDAAEPPAAGAKVGAGRWPGPTIHIKNGDIDDPSTYTALEKTPTQPAASISRRRIRTFSSSITHPSGFAYIKSTPEWDLTRIIHLEPWSRVEGTFRIGKALASNVPIELDVSRLTGHGRNEPHFYVEYQSVTRPDGRFVFERVIPGKGWIGRRLLLTVDDGATDVTSAASIPAEFSAGKTTHMDLGGTGRAVIGKLRPPDGFTEKIRWNFALITVRCSTMSPDGASYQFTATVDRDGSFRIDDAPAGDHVLSVDFFHGVRALGLLHHAFNVPPAKDDKPFDLGTLALEKR